MTRKEIEAARESLPARFTAGRTAKFTPEQERLDKELSCREMINSILCYYGVRDVEKNRYMTNYMQELGMSRVRELIEEQKADFENAKVIYGVADGYNAIIWADEDKQPKFNPKNHTNKETTIEEPVKVPGKELS